MKFYIALGYKGDVIKRFFIEYADLQSDLTVHLEEGRVTRRVRHKDTGS